MIFSDENHSNKRWDKFRVQKKKMKSFSSKFVFIFLSSFDDVGVEVLGGERLDLVLDLGRRGLAHRLLLAQEDGRVTVDPVLQGLLAEVALVDDRLEFAEIVILISLTDLRMNQTGNWNETKIRGHENKW